MPRPLRVLLLLNDCTPSGVPRMAAEWLQSLPDDFEVRILALDTGPMGATFQSLAPMRVLSEMGRFGPIAARLEKRIFGLRGVWLRLAGRLIHRRWIARWRPDVVYVYSAPALTLARYVDLSAFPAVLHVHETGTATQRNMKKYGALFTDWPRHFLAVSGHAARTLEENGIAAEKITVALNFLSDSTRAQLQKLATIRAPRALPFIVGGVGPVRWCKGPEVWLLAARELVSILGAQNVRFEWLGAVADEPQNNREFLKMAQNLGIAPLVSLLPTSHSPFEIYTRWSALAFTSWEDSFGLAAVENAILGNIVACFAQGGGAPEALRNAGIIVREFNPTEMAREVAEALQKKRSFPAPPCAQVETQRAIWRVLRETAQTD